MNRFAQAVEARAEDGDALVDYARAKVHEAPTSSYSALIEAGRPDLTVEAVVTDADADWALEFTEVDRAAAQDRLGTMIEAHREKREAVKAVALRNDAGMNITGIDYKELRTPQHNFLESVKQDMTFWRVAIPSCVTDLITIARWRAIATNKGVQTRSRGTEPVKIILSRQ